MLVKEPNGNKLQWNSNQIHSRKYIWKCCLQNVDHFFLPSVCYVLNSFNETWIHHWLSARLQYLQCVSNGDIAVLHYGIDMRLNLISNHDIEPPQGPQPIREDVTYPGCYNSPSRKLTTTYKTWKVNILSADDLMLMTSWSEEPGHRASAGMTKSFQNILHPM